MRRSIHKIAILVAAISGLAGNVSAAPATPEELMCPDSNIFGSTLITGVCWSCMFPVYLSGIEMFDGRNGRPAGANEDRLCYCEGDLSEGELPTIGFSVGLYIPSRIMEVVRKPWCFPSLFGADLGDANIMDGALAMGGTGPAGPEMTQENRSFYSWHLYSFPLLELLSLANLPQCNVDNYTSFDIMFMSEPMPHWYDGELAFLVHPEALLFGNPIAQAAGLADCTAASTTSAPLNSVFWMSGCWGSHYPLTGHTGAADSVTNASLAASRALYLLGRLGFIKRTLGDDAMCGGVKMPVLTKSQYKFQQLFPVPESNDNDPGDNPPPPDIDPLTEGDLDASATSVPAMNLSNVRGGCCHNLGENTMLWGAWRTRPGTGNDFVYLVWRWTDCCVGILGRGL